MSTSGSIEAVELQGRGFAVTSEADSNRFLGGTTNEIVSLGNGGTITKKTRKPWKLDGLVLAIDNTKGDLEFLQDLADGTEDFPITVTYADGTTYQGDGQISDDFDASSADGTATVTLMGPFKLTQQ